MADLGALLEGLPLPTIAIDADERIRAANQAARALLGKGATGRHYITVLRQPAVVEAVERCLQDDTARKVTYHAAQDRRFEVHLARVGATGPVLVSFQDMTQMTQAGQMRRDFVANVSHELRTPLTALMGFIETLQGPAEGDSAARARFLGIMRTEAGRMNRLIGDLLSLSRLESDERVRPRTEIDLADVIATTVRNLRPLAVEADVDLTVDLAPSPLRLRADADQLQQVFTNLIENALKYGAAGGRVAVTAQTHAQDPALRGPAIRVAVTDHGPGIDPVHLPRLTERFYRIDDHRSRALGGTGLGLAIVKHILNRHRGRLNVTSQPGQGATFTVILPWSRDAAAPDSKH